MPITNFTQQSSFSLSRPNNSLVTFEFDTDPSKPGLTRITLPEKSTWTPEPHWHDRYVEHFRVIQGRVLLKVEGQGRIITPENGVQTIQEREVHEFLRADWDQPEEGKEEGEVVVEEWTDPGTAYS